MTERTGVFICECGPNIKDAMDVPELVRFASGLPGVVVAMPHSLLCSDDGKGMIGRIVREESCGVVVGHLTRDALVSALSELREPGRLADCQARSQRAGRERYNWSHAERRLLDLYRPVGLGLGTAARAADTG